MRHGDFERLRSDWERPRYRWDSEWPAFVRDAYAVDLEARIMGRRIPHPIGKGSGQLSLSVAQLEHDAKAGLAFAVLKTAVGEDGSGGRTMAAWVSDVTRMAVERRVSASGREGWTVTWTGRGWAGSLDSYAEMLRAARMHCGEQLPVIPSVKLHLPAIDQPFNDAEYRHTLGQLAAAWGDGPMLVEHDFSPTLAGDARSLDQEAVLRWIVEVPVRMRQALAATVSTGAVVSLKLMNSPYGVDFQQRMLAAASNADAVTVFNRLWDPERKIAYGGYDLLERNLASLQTPGGPPRSGTGGIHTGRDIVAYARVGCSSVQCHTVFQLPRSEYAMKHGTRTAAALHHLVCHPESGLIRAMLDEEQLGRLDRRAGFLRFVDLLPSGSPC